MMIEETATIATSVAAVITAIVLVWKSVLGKVEKLHLSLNSRLDELVASTRAASLAEGRAEGMGLQSAAGEAAALIVKEQAVAAAKILKEAAQVAAAELRAAAHQPK
jgi:hypothetical protein